MARKSSVMRMRMLSTDPPAWPDTAPTAVPTVIAMSIATTPTAREMRPPASMAAPTIASRWRRNLRHTSAVSDSAGRFAAAAPASNTSAVVPLAIEPLPVRDPRIEPGVGQVRDQGEENHGDGEDEDDRHDHRRVVGQDGADQERPDARHAEDLLGDDRPGENGWNLQRQERHHRNERVPDHVLDDRHALGQPLGAGGVHEIELDDIEHGRTGEARQGGALEEPEHRDRHDGLPRHFPYPAPARRPDIGAVDERQPVEVDAEEEYEEEPGEEG